jgi:hypothetical protein
MIIKVMIKLNKIMYMHISKVIFMHVYTHFGIVFISVDTSKRKYKKIVIKHNTELTRYQVSRFYIYIYICILIYV